jgi:hypothetical protein
MSSENLQTTYMMLIRRRNDISRRLNPQLEKFVIIAQLSLRVRTLLLVIIHLCKLEGKSDSETLESKK